LVYDVDIEDYEVFEKFELEIGKCMNVWMKSRYVWHDLKYIYIYIYIGCDRDIVFSRKKIPMLRCNRMCCLRSYSITIDILTLLVLGIKYMNNIKWWKSKKVWTEWL